MSSKRSNAVTRIMLVTLATVVGLVTDVFFVAVGKVHPNSQTDLTAYVDEANIVTEKTKALRGNIYDRNGNVIAQDNRTYNIVCILSSSRPSVEGEIAYVKDKEYTADVLSKILGMDRDKIFSFLSQDVYQTELGNGGRNLSKSVKDEIEAQDLPGIEFSESIQTILLPRI